MAVADASCFVTHTIQLKTNKLHIHAKERSTREVLTFHQCTHKSKKQGWVCESLGLADYGGMALTARASLFYPG